MIARTQQHRGFTLLELVLVLVIVTMVLAMAAPSLHGWSRGSRLRDAADQFIAVTRYARTQAVTNSMVYRLQVDRAAGRYWLLVQEQGDFVNLQSAFGRQYSAPEGMGIELLSSQGGAQARASIDFYPTGRIEPARVRISSGQTDAIEIACLSPAEGFAVQSLGGSP